MTFYLLYALIAVLDVLALALDWPAPVRWLTKPSLVAALAIYVWRHSQAWVGTPADARATGLQPTLRRTHRLLLGALVWAWLGDVLLLRAGAVAFTAGLASFLICHLLFLVVFARLSTVPLRGLPLWLGVAYGGVLAAVVLLYLPWLQAGMGTLATAVQLYMAMLCAMTVAAALLWRRIRGDAWGLLFLGTLLFVISDAILAWQVFRQPTPWGDEIVMATYAAAQAMIVAGVLTVGKGGEGYTGYWPSSSARKAAADS